MTTKRPRSATPLRRAAMAGMLLSLAIVTGGVLLPAGDAAGDGATSTSRPEDPGYTAGVKAIKAKDYAAAIPLLEGVVAKDGKNADAFNWLAYATRMNGAPAQAIPIYEKALAIDPKHKGAHEYIGEAHLTLDNLAKAKEHLARLNSLCFFPCSEYRDLKKAVEAYEASGGKVKPTSGW